MNETIAIRPATPEDRSTILSFVAALSEFEASFYDDMRPGAESAEEYLETTERACEDKPGAMLIAECEGQPVGFLWFRKEEDDDVLLLPAARLHGYISDIYVVPEFRGRGIGRLLLEDAEQRCLALGLERVRLHAIAANEGARKAYEAREFEAVAVTYEKRLKR